MIINLNEPAEKRGIVILQLAFRPFFLAAAIFSVIAMVVWMGIYIFDWTLPLLHIPPTTWHAHEMLFGYLLAVIAGFLLTAVKNWTGQQTLNGPGLLALVSCWAIARLIPLLNIGSLELMALFDNLFLLGLLVAVAIPVYRVRQWKQSGILILLLLMLVANLFFYAGALGQIKNGEFIGNYSNLYLVMFLVFVMARRVIPFFIERGVASPVELNNRQWLDIASLVIFFLMWLSDIIFQQRALTALIAATLALLHAIRLYDWHTSQMWKSPMVWILYLGYAFFVVGFLLKVAVYLFDISPFLSLHAFAFGGISVLTIGMMSRVSLGHTGRNVLEPPKGMSSVFIIIIFGAIVRVFFPLILPAQYELWIGLSQLSWIVAYSLFIIMFFRILVTARIDGQPG